MKPGETVTAHDVTILGPLNLPSMVPFHASQMFAGNVTAFLKLLAPKGELFLNLEDEILRETLVVHKNEVVHPRVAELLGVGQVGNLRAD